ncbi:MAG: ATP-binding protein [Deltaproteobacteria bacterium]|nr:ATP-binding protein [Deltaproteobacteria bacterium]
MKRYLENQVLKDLEKKMVFVGGPRQVGKTTMAQGINAQLGGTYLNWDASPHRAKILEEKLPPAPLWCFDELHKYTNWRNYLKGLYDLHKGAVKFLVTGSARLDYYRFGGDSLQGRYHYLRLHPLSVAELAISDQKDFETLLRLGGFPEPFFEGSETAARRWNNEYRQRLIDEDIRSIENVRDIGNLELLSIRLPTLVGSLLSVNALREDLQVNHKTVANWLDILERMYHIFRIYPWGSPQIKAIKKEPKHYQWNWFQVQDEGARFENFVASHLLKWVHFQYDTLGQDYRLCFFRDREQREVDFIVTLDDAPIMAVECKLKPGPISKHLIYFKKKFETCRTYQLCGTPGDPYISKDGITACHAIDVLKDLV